MLFNRCRAVRLSLCIICGVYFAYHNAIVGVLMFILSLTLLTWGRKFAILSYYEIRVGNFKFVYCLCYRYELMALVIRCSDYIYILVVVDHLRRLQGSKVFIVYNFLCIILLIMMMLLCNCIVNQSCVSYPWLDWLQGENFLNCRTTEWGSATSNLCIICVVSISFWPILIYENRMYWLWPI